jgi:hypothetical protein
MDPAARVILAIEPVRLAISPVPDKSYIEIPEENAEILGENRHKPQSKWRESAIKPRMGRGQPTTL